MAARLVDHLGTAAESEAGPSAEGLSLRELQVLQRVATGASNSEIAKLLNISESTIKAHLRNIMEKLQVKNRAEAVAKALNGGLLKR
jgi:DNA-binding NarL/FixJ family response regulator